MFTVSVGFCILLCLMFYHLAFFLVAVFQLKTHKGAVWCVLSVFPVWGFGDLKLFYLERLMTLWLAACERWSLNNYVQEKHVFQQRKTSNFLILTDLEVTCLDFDKSEVKYYSSVKSLYLWDVCTYIRRPRGERECVRTSKSWAYVEI